MFKKAVLPTLLSLLLILFLAMTLLIRNDNYTKNITIIDNANFSNRNVISLKVSNLEYGDQLHFFSNSTKIDVIIEGKKTSFTNEYSTKTLYTVDLDTSNTEIYIYLSDVNGVLTPIDCFYIANGENFANYIINRDAFLIIISVFMVSVSVLVIFLSSYYFLFKRRSPILLGWSLFFISSSLWSFSNMEFTLYILQNAKTLYFFQQYTAFMIPFSIALISFAFNKTLKNKLLSGVVMLTSTMLALVSFILDIGGMNANLIFNYITIVITIIYLVVTLCLILKTDKNQLSRYTHVYITCAIICSCGLLLDFANSLVNLPGQNGMYFTISLFFVYIIAILNITKEYIVKENYGAYLTEENARLSSSILLSQIKPHFLYNALNSISFLCKQDPNAADLAVIRFSRYLRQNMKCIESSDLIDFNDEIEHIKNYIYLETLRFPKMEIIYDLKYIDFKIPPLCIQPIVENAVKHGVSKNIDGGYVTIKSFITTEFVHIEIADNGPGFDGKVNMQGTGLSNISRRFKMILNADIEFGSVIGKGTNVSVKIPRKDVK